MITLLWQYFFESDVDSFRQVLARATHNAATQHTKGGGRTGHAGLATSPGAHPAMSPTLTNKNRQHSEPTPAIPKALAGGILSQADLNWRDSKGVTLLHQVASSPNVSAVGFATALLEIPTLDLYIQDDESGWTALHRALYFGNLTIARALMDRDIQDAIQHSTPGAAHTAGGLIKVKDWEGNSPFDVYGATITDRMIGHGSGVPLLGAQLEDDDDVEVAQGVSGDVNTEETSKHTVSPHTQINGDEMFAFGSNKNFTLGFGDEDDRQFPERIQLQRPNHLLRRLHREYIAASGPHHEMASSNGLPISTKEGQLPAFVQYRPIMIQDVRLSKLHSAVLTTDPEANLYMCGFGSGGRLGTGDETTRFGFVNVHGGGLMGKRLVDIGLGQDHTIAISSEGETFTWGMNSHGQLGYTSNTGPPGLKEDKTLQLLPRQVFGSLKREVIVGTAASRIHSVVFTPVSLFTFGKNEGQLGLVDSDARSLVLQTTPRKVAASLFSSTISSVSAIDRATVCLLENHDVWVFANYGYTKVTFPVESVSDYLSQQTGSASRTSIGDTRGKVISKVAAGGDTICAMSSMGDVFTLHVSHKLDAATTSASTTNPTKIRGALSSPQRIWSLKKGHMTVRDVDVGQDGSIIICTESGSVWRRVKRAKITDKTMTGLSEYKAKDYKFSRVPRLTRVTAVRSNVFGGYAAIRRDCDVLKTQIDVEASTIWKDILPLLSFDGLGQEDSDTEQPVPRFWTPAPQNDVASIRRGILLSPNIESEIATLVGNKVSSTCDVHLGTTLAETRIPIHEFLLAGRSEVMRHAFRGLREAYFYSIPNVLTVEYDKVGKILVEFQGVDFLTVLNLVLYLYSDSVVDVRAPQSAYRYRQIRIELMKLASHLDLRKLEQAVRVMSEPPKTLNEDLEAALHDPSFLDSGDIEIELDGSSVKVHSALMCQRCPFFEGLFDGRAAGRWLDSRREQMHETQEAVKVDLKHVDPSVFAFVLQHLYADVDERMFDDVVVADLDAFLDLILEVMSVANELMLDRLSQCCQKMLGRLVNVRNVCQLLNAVAPCSVTKFKDAALEYICLNLEGMLENHLLSELEDDIMVELDEVVKQNQLNSLPISKSGRAEAELLESHPELIDIMESGKRRKIDAVSLYSHRSEQEAKGGSAFKPKQDLLEDFDTPTSTHRDRPRSTKSVDRASPQLKAKKSTAEIMFAMDELDEHDDGDQRRSIHSRRQQQPSIEDNAVHASSSTPHRRDSEQGRPESSRHPSGLASSISQSPGLPALSSGVRATADGPAVTAGSLDMKSWLPSATPMTKLGMKDIMAQASSSRVSHISSELRARDTSTAAPKTSTRAKLSQKERKRQQQLQQQEQQQLAHTLQTALPSSPVVGVENGPTSSPASPWQIASRGPKVNLKDVLNPAPNQPRSPTGPAARTPSPMTLRQTVSGRSPAMTRRAASGSSQPPSSSQAQSRRSSSIQVSSAPRSASSSTLTTPTAPVTPTIKSIRHSPLPVEPTLQLSMADILSQQQTEKEIIKEAAAKRSLQEIQEEQAFQEWWDQESRRVRAEEEGVELTPSPSTSGHADRADSGRGRGKARGGVLGRGRGSGPVPAAAAAEARPRRKVKPSGYHAGGGETSDTHGGTGQAIRGRAGQGHHRGDTKAVASKPARS